MPFELHKNIYIKLEKPKMSNQKNLYFFLFIYITGTTILLLGGSIIVTSGL